MTKTGEILGASDSVLEDRYWPLSAAAVHRFYDSCKKLGVLTDREILLLLEDVKDLAYESFSDGVQQAGYD